MNLLDKIFDVTMIIFMIFAVFMMIVWMVYMTVIMYQAVTTL